MVFKANYSGLYIITSLYWEVFNESIRIIINMKMFVDCRNRFEDYDWGKHVPLDFCEGLAKRFKLTCFVD